MSTESTIDLVRKETINQTGNPNPTAEQMRRVAAGLGYDGPTLESIRLRRTLTADVRKALDELHKLRNSALKQKQDTAEARHKLAKFIYNSVKSKDASAIKKAEAEWKKLQKEQANLEGKLTELAEAKFQGVITKARTNSYAGISNVRAVLEAMKSSAPLAGEAAYLDSQNYKDMNTTKKLFETINDLAPEGMNPIQMDSRGIVINVEQLKDPENSPLRQLGYDAGSIGVLFEGDYNIFDGYNLNRTKLVKAFDESNAKMAQIGSALETVGDRGFEEEAYDAVRNLLNIQKDVAAVDEPLSGFFSVDDARQTELTNQRIAEIERDVQDTQQQIALIDSLPAKVKNKVQSNIALGIGNPHFQAWCADNGFTEMGEADVVTIRGKEYVRSYSPGRDDLAAIRAFNRQRKKGSGRFGAFQQPGTGEIIEFEYKGEKLVGERLRLHAADGVTGGVKIKVAVPGFDEPIVIRPEDKIEVTVLERNKDKAAPLSYHARQNRRMLKKSGDAIDTAKRQSIARDITDKDRAQFDGENVRTSDGRMVTKNQLAEAEQRFKDRQEAQIAEEYGSTPVVQKRLGGETYLVDSEGNTYRTELTEDGLTTTLIQDPEELEQLSEIEAEPALIPTGTDDAGENYTTRFIKLDELRSGKVGADSVFLGDPDVKGVVVDLGSKNSELYQGFLGGLRDEVEANQSALRVGPVDVTELDPSFELVKRPEDKVKDIGGTQFRTRGEPKPTTPEIGAQPIPEQSQVKPDPVEPRPVAGSDISPQVGDHWNFKDSKGEMRNAVVLPDGQIGIYNLKDYGTHEQAFEQLQTGILTGGLPNVAAGSPLAKSIIAQKDMPEAGLPTEEVALKQPSPPTDAEKQTQKGKIDEALRYLRSRLSGVAGGTPLSPGAKEGAQEQYLSALIEGAALDGMKATPDLVMELNKVVQDVKPFSAKEVEEIQKERLESLQKSSEDDPQSEAKPVVNAVPPGQSGVPDPAASLLASRREENKKNMGVDDGQSTTTPTTR